MVVFLYLLERNCKVYLKDRTRVFFAFLSVLMILLVYAVFLGDSTARSAQNAAGPDVEGIRWLVDSWIMAGILVVSSVTVPLSFFGMMLEDKREKKLDGLRSAPVPRYYLVGAYLAAAWLVAMTLCTAALILSQVYMVFFGGQWLNLVQLVQGLGILAASVFSGAAITFFLTVWIRSSGAFSSMATIIGTIIGFLTGIYIPFGALPETIQNLTRLIPAAYAAVRMRQIFMENPIARTFATAPDEAKTRFLQNYGVEMVIQGSSAAPWVFTAVLVGSGLFFLVLAVLAMNRSAEL